MATFIFPMLSCKKKRSSCKKKRTSCKKNRQVATKKKDTQVQITKLTSSNKYVFYLLHKYDN